MEENGGNRFCQHYRILKTKENGGKLRRRFHAAQPRAARFCPWAPGRSKKPMAARVRPIMLHCEPWPCYPRTFGGQIALGWATEKQLIWYKECRTVSVCNKACVASRTKKERPAEHSICKKSRPRRSHICVRYTRTKKTTCWASAERLPFRR